MKRWIFLMATTACLLVGMRSGTGQAQTPGWLLPNALSSLAESTERVEAFEGHPKVTSRLAQAAGALFASLQADQIAQLPQVMLGFARFDEQARVETYITLDEVTENTLNALLSAGAEINIYDEGQRLVQAWVPPGAIETLADLPFVQFIDLPNYGVTNAGSVTTQGDGVIRADLVRGQGITGSGVTVGVISDGINGLTSSIASGDLPAAGITMPAAPLTGGGISLNSPLPGATVFTSTPVGRSDLTTGQEGRPLLEIVYDIAPGAQLFFAPGTTTDRKSTRLNSSHIQKSRMPSSA